jgi:hypothetical protein
MSNTGTYPVTSSRLSQFEALWLRYRWLVLIVAIATRLLVLYYDGTIIGPDQGFQMAATKSLMEGRGITLEVFQLDDISASSTYNLTWWPPLYSYISAPLLALTGDFVTVLVMTVWFSTIVLYIAWFFILEQLAPLRLQRAGLQEALKARGAFRKDGGGFVAVGGVIVVGSDQGFQGVELPIRQGAQRGIACPCGGLDGLIARVVRRRDFASGEEQQGREFIEEVAIAAVVEVEQARLIRRGEQHVIGLEIAVDEAERAAFRVEAREDVGDSSCHGVEDGPVRGEKCFTGRVERIDRARTKQAVEVEAEALEGGRRREVLTHCVEVRHQAAGRGSVFRREVRAEDLFTIDKRNKRGDQAQCAIQPDDFRLVKGMRDGQAAPVKIGCPHRFGLDEGEGFALRPIDAQDVTLVKGFGGEYSIAAKRDQAEGYAGHAPTCEGFAGGGGK